MDLWIPQSPFALPIVGFAPFLCTLMARSRLSSLFIMALVCGLCHDLFTLEHRLGISAVAYLFSVGFNQIFRKKYYEEKLFPFFGVSFTLSLGYSLFFILFGLSKGFTLALNLKMLHYQLLVYPFFDALFGTCCVFIPLKVYDGVKRLFTPRYDDA